MQDGKLQTSKDDEQSPCTVGETNFLKALLKKVIKNCIVNFIDKTSNVAVMREVCAVCAVDGLKTETTVVNLADFAHKEICCSHCLFTNCTA